METLYKKFWSLWVEGEGGTGGERFGSEEDARVSANGYTTLEFSAPQWAMEGAVCLRERGH